MNKGIRNRNSKGQPHGYQEYYEVLGKLWLRGQYKNGEPIGYFISNHDYGGIGDEGTEIDFYIK